jgi:DNA-binding response OmpR family regulator
MSEKNPVKMLYIEDNIDDQLILKRVINKNISEDIKIDVAETAEEGYEKIKNENYTVIFLDYRLPDKTGLELLEEIRAEDIHTPVFFLTGMGNEKIAVEAMRRGVDDYIIKSEVQSKEFIESIRKVIEKKETPPVDSITLSNMEKTLLDEHKSSQEQGINLITENGSLTYSGIENYVKKHGIEVTSHVLSNLEEKGKLIKENEKRVIICPKCSGSISTLEQSRYICTECNSSNIMRISFMSHPFCGYTGDRKQFITETGLVCPNCETPLQKQLMNNDPIEKNGYKLIGLVFECEDCKKRFNKPEVEHTCLICGEKFTYKNMNYMKLASYQYA